MIRAVIADDEPLAQQRILRLLTTEPDIEVAAVCGNGLETLDAIRAHKPDLIFLDVQMPEVDGIGVLREIGPQNFPVAIFITAYDSYALQAFEANALDYLLKPFDEARFHSAVARARNHIANTKRRELTDRLLALLDEVNVPQNNGADRLIIKSGGRVVFIKTAEIDWVEAAANYVRIHSGTETYLMRETMNSFEARLDSSKFIRIHRSSIVNIEKIKELQPCNSGEYIVVLRNGKELSLSRSFKDRIQHLVLGSNPPLRRTSA
jgi:two-component system LytT family response regulator